MVQWVSSDNATVAALLKAGRIWVLDDRLPPVGGPMIDLWEVCAEDGDTLHRLMGRWLQSIGLDVPHSKTEREHRFQQIIEHVKPKQVALIIHDAHLLRKPLLSCMRLVAERYAPIILRGDALQIGAALLDDMGMMQRAGFCIRAVNIFEPPPAA